MQGSNSVSNDVLWARIKKKGKKKKRQEGDIKGFVLQKCFLKNYSSRWKSAYCDDGNGEEYMLK